MALYGCLFVSARAHVLCTRRAEERQDASRQDFASVNGSWITQKIPSGFQPSAVGPCLPSCSWRTRVRTGGESAREKESARSRERNSPLRQPGAVLGAVREEERERETSTCKEENAERHCATLRKRQGFVKWPHNILTDRRRRLS